MPDGRQIADEGVLALVPVTRGERIYFATVLAATLWVGAWGFLHPERIDLAIPFLVPPLHARFLGAIYLSGMVAMTACCFARRGSEIRLWMPMVAVWTGLLFIVSLFYLEAFDLGIPRSRLWFAAYAVFPLVAIALAWRHRGDPTPPGEIVPSWMQRAYLVEGVALGLLGLALLVFPGSMVSAWPWPITRLLSQLYSAPFLAYGVAGILMARSQTWPEIRIPALALGTFAVLALVASLLHRELFSADVAAWLWFAGLLGATTIALSTALAVYRWRTIAVAAP